MTVALDCRGTEEIRTDVLVVGGGAAGVATAVTAARQGLKVVLVERYGFCGGGAVAGLSGTICGLYEATDDPAAPPLQVVHGFVDEFIAALEARGGLTPPLRYGKTFTRVHEPLAWRNSADSLLTAAGVTIIYHATVTNVLMEGGMQVEGARVYTKEGTRDIRATVTVDASGDADLVAMAGLPSFVGRDGAVQNPTMIFRLSGVNVAQFRAAYGDDTIMSEAVSALIRGCNSDGGYYLPRSKIWLFPTTRPNELLCNCTRVLGEDGRELNPLVAADFTEAEIQGRRQVQEYARFFRNNLQGCQESFVNDTGVQVGIRQTRQVRGVTTLTNAHVVNGTKFASGIARSPWPIELHAGPKPVVEWLLNDFYEVPYNCFVPERGDGLLVAGRCLSAEHEAVASARVTAQCFSYGHAIGHAATVAVRERIEPRLIDGAIVRLRLNGEGARLD